MKNKKSTHFYLLFLVMTVLALSACNTMNGLGRDMQATGQAITGVFDGNR